MPRIAQGIVGLVFLISGWLKALDPDSFAIQIAYYGIVRAPTWVRTAAFGLIAIEIVLGTALLIGLTLGGRLLWLVGGLLLVFTGLLAYGWLVRGIEDCGCFGNLVQMSPEVSILKNLALIALTAYAWSGTRRLKRAPLRREMAMAVEGILLRTVLGIAIVGTIATFGYGLSRPSAQSGALGESASSESPKDAPFAQFRFEIEGETWDLGSGEYFVAMLSASCSHCEEEARKLNDIPKFFPDFPPIIGLCLGDEETLNQFRQQTGAEFPTVLIPVLTFFEFIGSAPPRFVFTRDGREIHHWDDHIPDDEELLGLMDGRSESLR